MATVVTIGLEYIKVGAIEADGGMGETLAALGRTSEGTCSMTEEDPQTTDFFVEENDDPVESIVKRGKTTLAWSIVDSDVDTLVSIFGGTKTGAGTEIDPYIWNAPDNLPTVEKSIELKPQKGMIVRIPRAKIQARFNSTYSKTGLFLIGISATVLSPTKSGEKRMYMVEPVA